MPDRMLASVEWKAAPGGDPGELDGYVSVFNNVDQGGDVVLPGAFKKTLADWSRAKQRLPLIADHNLSTEGVIGSVVEAKEDGVGLRIRARFSTSAKAQDVRRNLLEGHINGLSFTYETLKERFGTLAGKAVRYLEELRIFEATVTPFPMNVDAVAVGVKADEPSGPGLDREQFTVAMRKALDIPYPPARDAAVDAVLGGYHPNDAAGPATVPPTAQAAAGDGTAENKSQDGAAAYALAVIARGSEPRENALDGEPQTALAGPLAHLEVERASLDMDRLEAEIQRALGGTE
jgi:HK97 family phage prohead protease